MCSSLIVTAMHVLQSKGFRQVAFVNNIDGYVHQVLVHVSQLCLNLLILYGGAQTKKQWLEYRKSFLSGEKIHQSVDYYYCRLILTNSADHIDRQCEYSNPAIGLRKVTYKWPSVCSDHHIIFTGAQISCEKRRQQSTTAAGVEEHTTFSAASSGTRR